MKRKSIFFLCILSLLSSFLIHVGSNLKVNVKDTSGFPVHNLDTGLNYTSIQEAINANETLNGHTIFVEEGTYYENVIMNKTVLLIGENKSRTIIDGNHTGTVMNITANSVNITGFTIQNSGGWSDGIYVSSSGNNISKNVIINNTRTGIFLKQSSNNYISENKITDNAFVGIRLRDAATENIIANNNISNNQDAVLLEESSTNNAIIGNYISHNSFGVETGWLSSNNHILDNNIATNEEYGMLIHSNNNIISQNVVFNSYWGVLIGSLNNTIVGNNITYNDEYGIWLKSCSDNNIFENCISYNMDGIYLEDSSSSKIRGNNITANGAGIWIADAVGYDIYRNKLVSNIFGISIHGDLTDSSVYKNDIKANLEGINIVTEYFFNNTLYHNNFINNTQHVRFSEASPNFWDNGIEGNYWSNFTSDDLNQDGIGDTPYIIDIENIDNYPLMGLFSDFNATSEYHVQTISNSTVSCFQFNGTALSFNVSGENDTAGFCRICIPTGLMNATYKIYVNGTEVSYTLLPASNSTHSYLYFTYNHSTKEVIIIPEFPSLLILPLFIMATLLTAMVYRRHKHYFSEASNL